MIHLAIVLFSLLTAVDISVMSTILPRVIAALGDMELYPLMSSAYLVAFVVGVPIWGVVIDHMGCKRVYWWAAGLFLLGSVLCGAAPTMAWLIGSRLLQGIGAGGLMNVAVVAIARLHSTDRKRSLMQGLLSGVWAVGSIVGPVVGAWLATDLSWRWVFWLNVPLGGAALWGLRWFRETHERPDGAIDWIGCGLWVSGVLLAFGGWWHWWLTVIGACLLLLFVLRSRRVSTPLLPLRMVRNRGVLACLVMGLVSGVCLTTAGTFMSLYLQGALRKAVESAGVVVSAMSIGWACGSMACGAAMERVGVRAIEGCAVVVLGAGFVLLGLAAETALWYYVLAAAVVGMGLGAMINSTIVGMQRASHGTYLGRGTALLSILRSGGASIGVQVSGWLQLAWFRGALEQTTMSREVVKGLVAEPARLLRPEALALLPAGDVGPVLAAFGLSIERVFWLPVCLLVIVAPIVVLLPGRQR